NAVLAVLVTAVTITLQGMFLRRKAEHVISSAPRIDDADGWALVGIMKKQAVATLFFAYQAQISVWIISIFGSTDKVADVGALTRLAVLFAIIGGVVTGLAAPTLARCTSLKQLAQLFSIELGVYTLFAGVLFTMSLVFPEALLWILGGKY